MSKEKLPISDEGLSAFHFSERFKSLGKIIMRDLNNNTSSPTFHLYSKDDVNNYLKNPYTYQKQLRDAAVYMYGASSHFRRLIQYFSNLTDLSYVVAPYNIDTSTAKPKAIYTKYRKTLNTLTSMDIPNQWRKVLTVCFREDTFYGTLREAGDKITLQQLPSDYCDISVIEENVLNVSFDFSYFDTYSALLDLYPPEFQKKYELYRNNRTSMKWQELDSPNSFAIKYNTDVLNYSIPPFAGIFREIYDIEDYKQLKLTKEELENYAILVMQLLMSEDGEWAMDYDKAVSFWRNLDGVLPEEIGSVLSPMPITKISFDKSNVGDVDTVGNAEQQLYTAAGVSSLLFNNAKASSNALLLSIKADQSVTYTVVKSIEAAINRFIQSTAYGKSFKVSFLDCSPYNRKEVGDMYLKACQYGMPAISYYCASQGISQSDMDSLNFLEDEVIGVKSRFKPLSSSNTMSSSSENSAGRPKSELGDLSDSGEQSQEIDDGDNSLTE